MFIVILRGTPELDQNPRVAAQYEHRFSFRLSRVLELRIIVALFHPILLFIIVAALVLSNSPFPWRTPSAHGRTGC